MNVIEHLFDIAAEEAAELSRGLIRVNRFGLDSTHPRTERKASEEVVHQMNDLLAVIELMKDRGVVFDGIGDPSALGEAKKKLVEAMETSYEAGLITLPDDEEEGEGELTSDDVESEEDGGDIEGEEEPDETDKDEASEEESDELESEEESEEEEETEEEEEEEDI
jgi:hypothetical protein